MYGGGDGRDIAAEVYHELSEAVDPGLVVFVCVFACMCICVCVGVGVKSTDTIALFALLEYVSVTHQISPKPLV